MLQTVAPSFLLPSLSLLLPSLISSWSLDLSVLFGLFSLTLCLPVASSPALALHDSPSCLGHVHLQEMDGWLPGCLPPSGLPPLPSAVVGVVPTWAQNMSPCSCQAPAVLRQNFSSGRLKKSPVQGSVPSRGYVGAIRQKGVHVSLRLRISFY